MNDPNAALLSRIAEGSESALETFYREFESTVYRFALVRLNDPFEAAEILNEVMMEVWKHAGRFQGRSKVSTWVLGITHHKVLDRYRKRGRAVRETSDGLDTQLPDPAPVSDRLIEAVQDAQRVQDCLKRLPDNQRQAIHLAFFEDLPYGEIAGIMDVAEGTVKSRVYYAKEALKQCLEAIII